LFNALKVRKCALRDHQAYYYCTMAPLRINNTKSQHNIIQHTLTNKIIYYERVYLLTYDQEKLMCLKMQAYNLLSTCMYFRNHFKYSRREHNNCEN
jgi:hypothetical protein